MAWTDPHAKERKVSLDTPPRHRDDPKPKTHDLTSYSPAGNGPKNEVHRVTSNLSFASRTLFIIAEDKHFEDLTGEDGNTIGIGDFAAGSDVAFLLEAKRLYPTLVAEAFAGDAVHVEKAWLHAHMAGKDDAGHWLNDHGLIAIDWLRKGTARILADRRFYGIQLDFWMADKVKPSRQEFEKHGFTLEFTLAAMCGMANSMGPGGMRKLVEKGVERASRKQGRDRELAAIRYAVDTYAHTGASFRDDSPEKERAQRSADAAIAHIFDGADRPKSAEHRGNRMLLTGDWFPLSEPKEFDGTLGGFALEEGEKAPAGPTQNPPAPLPDRALSDGGKPKKHAAPKRDGKEAEEKKKQEEQKKAAESRKAEEERKAREAKERDEARKNDPPDMQEIEGDAAKVPVRLAGGKAEGALERPSPGTQLVWGGTDPSSPWGHLAALVREGGGKVVYTYLHAATLLARRDRPKSGGQEEPAEEKKKDEEKPPAPASGPMFEDGLDVEFESKGHKDARIWADPTAPSAGPRPLLIFLHGMSRPSEHPQLQTQDDGSSVHLGKLAQWLAIKGRCEPMVIAAPTWRDTATSSGTWKHFDLDNFVALVVREAGNRGVKIDLDRVTVAGHSAAGCQNAQSLVKVARDGAQFTHAGQTHELLVLGFADTCLNKARAGFIDAGLHANAKTVVYGAFKGLGGATGGIDENDGALAKEFAEGLRATAERSSGFHAGETSGEFDHYWDTGGTTPDRVVIHFPNRKGTLGRGVYAHQEEWKQAGAVKKKAIGSHYAMTLVWTWYALQRFYPARAGARPSPQPQPSPEPGDQSGQAERPVTGGEWANVPAAPPVWPGPGIAPRSTDPAGFADPITGIFWPVRTRHDAGRIVSYVDENKQGHGYGSKRLPTRHRDFLAPRDDGKRYHVAVDLFANYGDVVVAIEDGTIIDWDYFYHGVWRLLVRCKSNGLVINYGEVDKSSLDHFKLKKGRDVKAGQPIALIGKMSGGSSMLHLETYRPNTTETHRYHLGDPESALALFFNPTQYLLNLATRGR